MCWTAWDASINCGGRAFHNDRPRHISPSVLTMEKIMSPRIAPILFGLVLSALMSLLVSGISTFRNTGLVDGFVTLWMHAWLPSWLIAFPIVLVIAPLARRLVGMLVVVPSAQNNKV
jgi:hypothetical protein